MELSVVLTRLASFLKVNSSKPISFNNNKPSERISLPSFEIVGSFKNKFSSSLICKIELVTKQK